MAMKASEPYPCKPSVPVERSLMHWLKMARSCGRGASRLEHTRGSGRVHTQRRPVTQTNYRVLGQRLENTVGFRPPLRRYQIAGLWPPFRASATPVLTRSGAQSPRACGVGGVPRGLCRRQDRFCRGRRSDSPRLGPGMVTPEHLSSDTGAC
jgi:hypothetical protein